MEQHETRAYDPDDFKPERAPQLAFPDDDWQWFRDACADFGIPDPDAHRETLQRLYSHLVHVNAWLNLLICSSLPITERRSPGKMT